MSRQHACGALVAGAVLVFCVLIAMPAAAQNTSRGAASKLTFEFEAGGGGEWERFATVGPYSNLSTNIPFPRTTAAQAERSGWSGVFDAHVLFRPRSVQPLNISAYRIDFLHSRGTADTTDAFLKQGVGTAFQIPHVNGSFLDGLSGADGGNISSSISQDRTSWRAKSSLVWERSTGQIATAFRLGAGFASLRQNETISIRATDQIAPALVLINATTTGELATRAFGLVGGIDVRALIQPGLALLGGLEANLDFARTNYDGRSTDNLGITGSSAITDSKSHIMSELRANGGFEWMPTPGLAFRLLGDAGWRSGVPRIIYPQYGYPAGGFLSITTDGPAHIGLENRWFYGARAVAVLRF